MHRALDAKNELTWWPLTVAATVYLFLFLFIAVLRIGYKYELEWMEGLMVDHVDRVLHGQPIYVEPSLDFVPAIYTPLYYYVAAAFAEVVGLEFVTLRVLSLLATIGTLIILYHWVKRETSDKMFGLIAAGLYAGCFRACGAWFDIARDDTLFIFFLIAGFYLYRANRTLFGQIAASLLLAAASFTKQSALIATIPLMVFSLVYHRWRDLPFLVSYLVLIIGGFLTFNWLTAGWFAYYTITLPASHQIVMHQIYGFWSHDILRYTVILLVMALTWLTAHFKKDDFEDTLFWLALLAGGVGTAWSSRMHSGGYDNVLIPAFLMIILIGSISLHHLARELCSRFPKVNVLLLVAGLAQFALLWYNPAAQIPTSKDRETGDKIVASLREVKGDVWLPFHGHLAEMAGKRSFAHRMAISDVTRADSAAARRFDTELHQAIERHEFGLIVTDAAWCMEVMNEGYLSRGNITGEKYFFYPMTGLPTRPLHWLVPK